MNGYFEIPITEGKTENQLNNIAIANSNIKSAFMEDYTIVQQILNVAIYEAQQVRRAEAADKLDTQGPVDLNQAPPEA